MNLFEMTKEVQELYELLEREEIDEETFTEMLTAIGADDKLAGYCQIIKCLNAELSAHESEKKRHEARIDTLKKRIERMKEAQIAFLTAAGKQKMQAGTWTVSIRNTVAVKITDENALPMMFRTVIPAETRPNRREIMAALKAGQSVSGAELEMRKSVVMK